MNHRSISDLELFIEKSELLVASNFYQTVQSAVTGTMYAISKDHGEEHILLGPEGECIDAALLTLRMFMQDNDRISIKNMSKIFQSEAALSNHLEEFKGIRKRLNQRFNQNGNVYFYGKSYTFRETLELFLYGSYAHANREKANELKKILTRDSSAVTSFKDNLNHIIALFIANISCISNLAKKALAQNANL